MSEEVSLHLYYSIIGLASLILFSGEITLLYNYTVFRHAWYGVIPTVYTLPHYSEDIRKMSTLKPSEKR
jgi:hypothetical protein